MMDNKQKAVRFMAALAVNDPRCQVVIMMLSIAFGITQEETLSRIKALAE